MIRRTAVLTLVAPLVASLSLLAPAQAAPADEAVEVAAAAKDPAPGQRCRETGKIVMNVRDIRHAVKVAYARSFVLSPGESWRKVRHVRKDEDVSSSYAVSGGFELQGKGLTKLLGKVEAEIGVATEGFSKTYTSTETTVNRRVQNPTRKNKEFVAYKGTHDYRGKYMQLFCAQHPVMSHPEWTIRSQGAWRTHRPLEEGTIRCGAGAPNELTRYVARRHCG